MSHVIITCTCGRPTGTAGLHAACAVPGHGDVPRDPVDPWALVDAGLEAIRHLNDAMTALMKARAAWVGRGLDETNPFPVGLDIEAMSLAATISNMRDWTLAATSVAEQRAPRDNASKGDDMR